MSSTLFLLLIIWYFAFFFFSSLIQRCVGLGWSSETDGLIFGNLRRRLKGYARLKHARRARLSKDTDHTLSPHEFEVLLGILKKIEAKNAALSTVWALIVTGLLAAMNIEALECYRTLVAVGLAAVLPFLATSLQGMSHVDQIHTNRHLCDSGDLVRVRNNMAIDLMKDLLKKEASYRVSWSGAVVSVFVLAMGAFFALVPLSEQVGK